MIELALRPGHSPAGAILTICIMPTLLWRRSMPLAMISIAFGATACVSLARLAGSDLLEPSALVFVLVLVWSLFRWGSGREALIGVPIILVPSVLGLVSNQAKTGDFVGGFAVVLSAMALGIAFRYRARVRFQEIEREKMRERERLARDLHDTVAHHVSAIGICAQAGLATAPIRPDAAVDALKTIAAEASRTLAEMRTIVRSLRGGASAEFAPGPGVADIQLLAVQSAGSPAVEVHVAGDVDALSPTLSSALFRLAQESITNARRHARNATRIDVGITVDEASVRLRVSDDGHGAPARMSAPGFGLVGMVERAELLGGTCTAGPAPERGWSVDAILPRKQANP